LVYFSSFWCDVPRSIWQAWLRAKPGSEESVEKLLVIRFDAASGSLQFDKENRALGQCDLKVWAKKLILSLIAHNRLFSDQNKKDWTKVIKVYLHISLWVSIVLQRCSFGETSPNQVTLLGASTLSKHT
jgi:hypothetical protein